MREVAGRVVVITGGARGIGAAMASSFVKAGARVAIGDIDAALAQRTADEIGCLAASLDVTCPGQFGEFLDRVEKDLGPVDVLVNNAGIMPVTAFVDESVESIQRQLAINVAGVIYGTQQAVRRMSARNSGHVVNVASAAGTFGFGGVATYSACKFAVVGLTEAVALEHARTGIQFTCVIPGMVNTELVSGLTDHWMLRTCSPDDVAAAVLRAVRHNRRRVYIPKRLAAVASLSAAMPSGARTRLMKALGADRQMLVSATPERAAYEQRIIGLRR